MKRHAHDHHDEPLDRYNAMRDFDITAEPPGRLPTAKAADTKLSFVVQKHAATRLHYDFRLELDGVLLSWAVPKGPSLSPGDRRLAVQTEDHPFDYRDFEGTIPEGQYGGGAVIVWDRGSWTPIGDPREGMKKGRLDFTLDGEKLQGRFLLVRTKSEEKKPTWLLMKRNDEHVRKGRAADAANAPRSILTGRTIEDIERGVPAAPPSPKAKTRTRTPKRRGAAKASGAKLPAFGSVGPELATLVKAVPRPSSAPWVWEIKYDGYRTLGWLDDGKVQLASRRGLDWTAKYPLVADALSRVRARNAIFDGEVAYVLSDGRTSFQKLQNALGSSDPNEQSRLVYFVFDLLFYDGVDLRDRPLEERKAKLRTILAGEGPPLRLSEHVEDGEAFFREACKVGLEGIIGKRLDRPYIGKRTPDWIKVKCQERQELVIVGFTPPRGRRKGIGALLVGVREGEGEGEGKTKRLRYAGKVGTGFSEATIRDLVPRLEALVIETPAVEKPPPMKEAIWVEPKLVAQVRFTEWTTEGVLRHPSFEGLRLDKLATEVVRETPKPAPKKQPPTSSGSGVRSATTTSRAKSERPKVGSVSVSHPERIIDPASGRTKLDLVRYVDAVANVMLPFVAKRPLMMLRCPGGMKKAEDQPRRQNAGAPGCFVQKHSGQGLDHVGLGKSSIGGEEVLYATRAEHLVALAQNNVVELHGWGTRLPRGDRPDWIVLDLDPDEALPFSRVVEGALEMRETLRTIGLESWLKTTGGKGLHLVVPLARRYDWATVKGAAHAIATSMAEAAPKRWVATMSKKARAGRIFLDYLRNGEGATAVLPYSPRARPGLTVALPIAWKDLPAIDPRELTIDAVVALLAKRRSDPWADLLDCRQTLPRELVRASASLR